MAELKVTMGLDNAGMREEDFDRPSGPAIAVALGGVAGSIHEKLEAAAEDTLEVSGIIHDVNGNSIGHWTVRL